MIAADRAVQTARMVNEPLLLAASAYRLANVFLPAGRTMEAKEVALSAAGGLERHLDASPAHLAYQRRPLAPWPALMRSQQCGGMRPASRAAGTGGPDGAGSNG
jgi:hypothetical protein